MALHSIIKLSLILNFVDDKKKYFPKVKIDLSVVMWQINIKYNDIVHLSEQVHTY